MEVVYSITNKYNYKVYIGSTVDYKKRLQSHINGLRGGYHDNWKLQKNFNNFGEDYFVFDVIHKFNHGNDKERFELEEQLIKQYKTYETGYNLSYNGRGKYVITDKTRNKMRENSLGENNPFYGKTHTKEVRKMLSDIASKRTREDNPFYGKSHTEDSKNKIREGIRRKYVDGWVHPQKGVPKTDYHIHKNKISQPSRKSVIAEGKEFLSAGECAKEFNISRTTVRNRINSDKFPEYYFVNDR